MGQLWRECRCGCNRWHLCADGDPDAVICTHRGAPALFGDPVPWAIDPSARCGECLLTSDQETTRHVRSGLAATQSVMVEWMDAGVRLIGQQIATDAQIQDMIAEGGPAWGEP